MPITTPTPAPEPSDERPSDAGADGGDGVWYGSYGLQLTGTGDAARALAGARRWLLPPDPSWPRWHVEWLRLPQDAPPAAATEELTPDRATLVNTAGSGWIEIDRVAQRTRFHMPGPPSSAALVHPYLTSTAAIAGHWLGRTPFHAGGLVVGDRVWGVLGGREMGKSSLLMAMHEAGALVVSDDLVVVDHGRVYSGPRCLDLRAGAAKRFGAGEPIGHVGRRDRWRVDLPAAPGVLPLAGWVVLGWADDVVIEPVDGGARLAALATNRAIVAPGAQPRGLLDAATLPMLLFGRPRDWDVMSHNVDRLLSVLATS